MQTEKSLPVLALLAGLWAATVAAYMPGLSGPFLLDDLSNLEVVKAIDAGPQYYQEAIKNSSGPLGRPVSMLTFAVNYYFQGMSPYAFKATNLAIHIITSLLVFLLSRALASHTHHPRPVAFAFAVCAFWTTAPILLSTTLYPVQRMTQLSALFSLAACWMWIESRGRDWRAKVASRAAAVVLLFPLALFSKENGALVPLLLALTHVAVDDEFRSKYRRHLVAVFVAAPVVIVALASVGSDLLPFNYEVRNFSAGERLLTQTRALSDYVFKTLLPIPNGLGVYHDDYTVSRDLLSPPTTVLAATFVLLLYAAGVVLLFRKPLLGFGILFFFIAHSAESTLVALELYFEHRNYLPAVGLFIAAAGLVTIALQEVSSLRRVLGIALVALFTMNTFVLYNRAHVWSDGTTLLATALREHPDSPRVLAQASVQLASNGKLEAALALADRIDAADSRTQSRVWSHRILLYCMADRNLPNEEWDRVRTVAAGQKLRGEDTVRQIVQQLERCPNLNTLMLEQVLLDWLELSFNDPEWEPSPNAWKSVLAIAKVAAHNEHFATAAELCLGALPISGGDVSPLMMAIYYKKLAGDEQEALSLLDTLEQENNRRVHSDYVRHIIDFYRKNLFAARPPAEALPGGR